MVKLLGDSNPTGIEANMRLWYYGQIDYDLDKQVIKKNYFLISFRLG